MTRSAPPPMKTMLPRRAYLLEVESDPSPFVGLEMLDPPPTCMPRNANRSFMDRGLDFTRTLKNRYTPAGTRDQWCLISGRHDKRLSRTFIVNHRRWKRRLRQY